MQRATTSRFYSAFRRSVLIEEGDGLDESDYRVNFILKYYDMIPRRHHELIFSLCRAHPTPPIYTYLILGILGTNVTKFCAFARPGCHTDQWERAGAFYNFIAESRLGKGIAMSLLWKLGSHVQQIRVSNFVDDVDASTKRPKRVFLPGGNGLQSQSEAFKNAGCGILYVPEIKNGKRKYTDIDGSYGPLLSFYDTEVPGITFRKAEDIPDINNYRIQIVSAGVAEDWQDLLNKSGPKSGTLARILPVIGMDRQMIRLLQDKLPLLSMPLNGIKSVLSIMETKFASVSSLDKPSIILQFEDSTLLNNFRLNNDINTNESRAHGRSTLLDSQPPNCDLLKTEGSGVAKVDIFLKQTYAEFKSMIKSPADENCLNGLQSNLLRVSCDFF